MKNTKKMPSYSGIHQKLSSHLDLRNVPDITNPNPFVLSDSILEDEDLELEQEQEFIDSMFMEQFDEMLKNDDDEK